MEINAFLCSILNLTYNDNDFIFKTFFARYGVASGNAPTLYVKA